MISSKQYFEAARKLDEITRSQEGNGTNEMFLLVRESLRKAQAEMLVKAAEQMIYEIDLAKQQ